MTGLKDRFGKSAAEAARTASNEPDVFHIRFFVASTGPSGGIDTNNLALPVAPVTSTTRQMTCRMRQSSWEYKQGGG
jgi:hypothetical protein